jgi:hypothetical protein
MQTTKIFKFSRNVFAAAGVAFISCIIARTQAQDASPAKAESSATATSAEKADTEWDGVTVELTSVKRNEGGSITVQFKYTNTGSKNVEFWTTGNYGRQNLAALVYYIDPKNKKKYTVIEDSDHAPVASSSSNISLEPGASKLGWAKLSAPPADVNSITVFIPGAPPFEKVALAAQ